MTDEDHVRACLAGDRDAFACLVERYQSPLVGYLARMVGETVALDVAQESFVRAWQGLGTYDPRWKFKTWLYAIASNAAIDHLRARRQRRLVPLDVEPSADTQDASDAALGAELARSLDEAIALLPDEYREPLLMRHPGGLAYAEIAESTGLPLGTVKVRIFRARQRLRQMLGDLLPAEYAVSTECPLPLAAARRSKLARRAAPVRRVG